MIASEAHERFLKLRTSLELLDDAGLLEDLQQRWQEREAERDLERVAKIAIRRQERYAHNVSDNDVDGEGRLDVDRNG
jgi:hypothetical protein